jgi:broad specificity polyphosphatase/5'/3'-nucleotidase SurE
MAASLSGVPSIALSFGLMGGYKPPPDALVTSGIEASCNVIKKLWETGWGEGKDRVDVYSVNVPVCPLLLYS